MLDKLACKCEDPDCDRWLARDEHMLTMTTEGGTRRAYECACGTVTVTVLKQG